MSKKKPLIRRVLYILIAIAASQLLLAEDANLLVRIICIIMVFAVLNVLNWAITYLKNK